MRNNTVKKEVLSKNMIFIRTKILSGAELLANLTPMKRILCLCPVVTGMSTDRTQGACQVGMAVSDPYLFRASPIVETDTSSPLEIYWHSCQPEPEDNFPETSRGFTELIHYSDVGAIALALPMKTYPVNDYEDQFTRASRDYILKDILTDYFEQTFSSKGLVAYIDEPRLTLEEARVMAEDDPDMWEEMEDFLFDSAHHSENIHPSLHASVALNQFLWKHTGGWQNTFG